MSFRGVVGEATFLVMKAFWSSATERRRRRARAIRIPGRPFNDEIARLRRTFLVIGIEGGEGDVARYARVDGVRKICVELNPRVVGQADVDWAAAASERQGFREDQAISDQEHKPFVRVHDVGGPLQC